MIPNGKRRKANIHEPIRSKLITKSEGCKVKMEECKANSKGQWQRWHYLAVEKLSVLLRGIKSKKNDLFLLSELPSFL